MAQRTDSREKNKQTKKQIKYKKIQAVSKKYVRFKTLYEKIALGLIESISVL